MRGLSLNLQLPTSCNLRLHNGNSSRRQDASPLSSFSNRRVLVCRQRLRSKEFDPLSNYLQCKRLSICRAHGPPPPEVREEDPVQEEDNPEGEKIPEESDVVASITSWGTLPPRFKLIITTALAFVICNMDKVSHPFLQPSIHYSYLEFFKQALTFVHLSIQHNKQSGMLQE